MSVKSFWKAESTIPIIQTSKAVTALNGLSFEGGQEVRIKVPPSTKFFQPKECYLQADIKLSGGTVPTKLQLDSELGGQILIKDIRIYSSAEKGSVLLEEIQGYNSMVSIMRDFDTNDSEKKKRAMTEGATVWIPYTRGTRGSTKSSTADILTNPYFVEDPVGASSATTTGDKTGAMAFNTAKLCLPLETGIFRSEAIFPNMLSGLEVVITLEDAGKCVTQLDSVMRNRRLNLNPRFHSRSGSNVVTGGGLADAVIANGDTIAEIYLTTDNSQVDPYQCPFSVGETVSIVSQDNATLLTTDKPLVIASINASSTADNGAGLLQIIFNPADAVSTQATTLGAGGVCCVVSQAVVDDAAYSPSYSLSNVELVVQEVDPGSAFEADMIQGMKMNGGVIAQDIVSCQNYRYSQNVNDIVANIRLPLQNARAKSIVCQPTDASAYTDSQRVSAEDTYVVAADTSEDITLNESTAGLRGISDNIQDFQFLYDGRLQPSRPVRCSKTSSKTSIDAQPLIETTKALLQGEVNARSLHAFNSNFLVSRALALNKGVYDTRNKDFSVQVNYGNSTTKNKLWNNFVFHLRRINIRGDNISVEY
jgi:hypothetical protein